MKSCALLLAIPCLLLASVSSSASTLTDYNVVVLDDFTGAFHVAGATFVGGNLSSLQMSEFNHRNTTPDGYDGLRVGGTVSGKLKVMDGETVSYNAANGVEIECQGGAGGSSCITAGASHSAEKAQLAAEMAAMSLLYDGMTANGVLRVDGNQVHLTYTGSEELAVFDVTASNLWFQNASLQLSLGSATRAVINVVGDANLDATNFSGTWDYSNTLFNFVDATSVNVGQGQWRGGSLLAPKAAVTGGSGFEGALYVQSYTRGSNLAEIHDFRWTPDKPTASVPDGGSLTTVLGAVLAGMVALRRRLR